VRAIYKGEKGHLPAALRANGCTSTMNSSTRRADLLSYRGSEETTGTTRASPRSQGDGNSFEAAGGSP
jgi:hypothetical protein